MAGISELAGGMMQNCEIVKAAVHKIGREMVDCGKQCLGVGKDKNAGILPRCLYFEESGDLRSRGCVIVGINPGNSSRIEQKFYVARGPTYESELAFWDEKIKNVRYYARLRQLARALDLEGPVLWTELVKCEDIVKKNQPPIQTFRVCTKSYLNRELEAVPDDWPLIAVSRAVFNALAFLYPNRAVIGVPHPTGGFGNSFFKLFDAERRLLESLRPHRDDLWGSEGGEAIWLDAARGHYP